MSDPAQRSLFGDEPVLEEETKLEATSGLFAEIVFNRPLDHAYTYGVPATLAGSLAVGKRVLAPFGKGDRATPGFCVGLTETGPERKVKDLKQVLDDEALLTADLLRLTRWMADYYLCGWGQVLNAVVPTAVKEQAGSREIVLLELVEGASWEGAAPTREGEAPAEPSPAGSARREPRPPKGARPPKADKLSAKQKAVLEKLREAGRPLTPRQLAKLAGCGSTPIEKLVAGGLIRRLRERVESDMVEQPAVEEPGDTRVELNPDQLRVWTEIERALRARSVNESGEMQAGFQPFLLHGVTGSGKTEIYLRAIQEMIDQGKESLVLVPEISLTPQTIARFKGRFGDVAVLHSNLKEAERGQHWRRVANGQVHVVVGARSAVFAPTRRLGLIVIDEEHEGSFKQDSTPRYHARDVAVMRARLQGIPILLGSATPSLESWHNAQRGAYRLLTLPSRVLDRPLPRVALVDLRHEPPAKGKFQALSHGLERAMREALAAGGQVMLLLNRRGFSTHIHCPSCGHVEMCKFCDLALTYHREREVLLCHHCGYEQPPSMACPQCSQTQIRYQGLGTEKLQAEIESKFPDHSVRRMDSDTTRRPGSHERILSAFRKGLIHILMGTQMIAKGLDFPNVTLVGVVNADVGLNLPDFRSAERTFQLLSQVAGRAGRGAQGGKVVVQTWNPEQPCIALAAQHDYLNFVAAELAARREHAYPPFQRMARLIVRSRDQAKAESFAELLSASFQHALPRLQTKSAQAAEVRLLGPAEAPVFRLKNYYRYHFQLQSPSPGTLHQLLRAVLPTLRVPAGVEYTLDVDPLNML